MHYLVFCVQALRDKYLDPPKSLHEAAKRTWLPIHSRTLVFDRRRQKAAAAHRLSPQQLLEFYDMYLHPDGLRHQALCVQVWGGRYKAPVAEAATAATSVENSSSSSSPHIIRQQHGCSVTVLPDGLVAYKRNQPTMTPVLVQLPPPATTDDSRAGT